MKHKAKILYLAFLICGISFCYLNAAEVKFNISNTDRVLLESESFLRYSGYKTVFLQGNIVEASLEGRAPVRISIINLKSDSSQSEGVLCYVTTTDSGAFDSLSKDLNTFSSLYKIPIDIIRTRQLFLLCN